MYKIRKNIQKKFLKFLKKKYFERRDTQVKNFAYPSPYPYTGYAEFCVSVSRVSVFFVTLTRTALSRLSYHLPFGHRGVHGEPAWAENELDPPNVLAITEHSDAVFYRMDPLLYHKFGNMVILGQKTYIQCVAQETSIIRKLFIFMNMHIFIS